MRYEHYIDFMAGPVAKGLSLPRTEHLEVINNPVAVYFLQPAVKEYLDQVQWEELDLPNVVMRDKDHLEGELILTPREFAHRLMVFAFDDTFKILARVRDFLNFEELPNNISLGQLLLNSGKYLLLIAQLPDIEKSKLIRFIEDPDLAQYYSDNPDFQTKPFILNSDKARVEWSPEVKDWIKDRLSSDSGCPAFRKTIETELGKQNLMHYFWVRLISNVYEV